MLPGGQLKKLKIKAYTDAEFKKPLADGEYEAQVNPETYTIAKTIEYNQDQAQGTDALQQRYAKTVPQNMDFEFVFDGTGVLPAGGIPFASSIISAAKPVNIVDAIAKFKKVVYDYNGDNHEPPYVKLYWGTLLFKGRLTNLSITYKLFKPDGTPIRAVAKCTFQGSVDDTIRVAITNPSSPDLTHLRTVMEGDTLPLMTYRIYDDASLYLEVARVNKLTNFRKLVVGQQLFFPPIENLSK
jgi:hypothetical protein